METTTGLVQPPPAPAAPPAARFHPLWLLGCRIDPVDRRSAVERVKALLSDGKFHQIVTANPLMLLAAQEDADLAKTINAAALVVPESSGIAWALRRAGTPLKEFVPGIDLFQALCGLARDTSRSIFLLGARPGVAERAVRTLGVEHLGLRVVGTHHGYFKAEEMKDVIARVRSAAPDFLFVAMSVPGQEKWIQKNLEALGVPVVMGVGGSLDVVSGRLRRAPAWMRDLGLEWAYRTLQEPWRIKRVMHLPLFVWKVLRSRGGRYQE